ncbi:MAG: hypothetical protein PHF25_05825 [Candidatus Margulisbacteria bacterium]|nr:hypothetical protein [Candidatus Margulisiibacteriota bacterium]
MRIKYFFFFAFVVLLYLIFLRVDYTYKSPSKTNEPNLVLLNANIEHFLQGELEFNVVAKKIEIFDKKFIMHESTINSEDGLIISADVIDYYLDRGVVYASSNVYFKRGQHVYSGNELEYDMTRLLLKTYRGGEFVLQ